MRNPQIAALAAWVDKVGGTAPAAVLLCCSPSFLSNIKAGRRKPGRALAVRIASLVPSAPVAGWEGVST